MMIDKFGDFEMSQYQDSDFERIAELFCEVYVQTYPNFDEKFHNLKRFQTILRDNTLPNSKVWKARYDGEIIGFIAIGQNEIDQFYISENFQNSGLGSFWINQTKLIYPDFLELYTFECNEKAIAFYKKHNFKIIEKSIAPDEKMLDVKMRWQN